MGVPLHTALVYYVFPVFAFSIISLIFYQVLSTPLGWFIVPALAGVAAWVRYARNTEKKIKNGERYLGYTISFNYRWTICFRYNAIVVGAGFSGLCMGAKLSEGGVPFTIFEASTEVGGTWHHNTYPGCACDVWTTLYQFTFFQNPDWSRYLIEINLCFI